MEASSSRKTASPEVSATAASAQRRRRSHRQGIREEGARASAKRQSKAEGEARARVLQPRHRRAGRHRRDDHPGQGAGRRRRRRRGAALLGGSSRSTTAPATCAAPCDVLLDEIDEIAELLTREQGKPRVESYTMELLPTVDSLKWIADNGPDILADEKISDAAADPEDEALQVQLRADRRGRRDRALELPLVDPVRRGRDRADGGQRRRAEAGQPHPADRRADPRDLREGGLPRGPGPHRPRRRAGSATRWSSRPRGRSSSPARSRSGTRCGVECAPSG